MDYSHLLDMFDAFDSDSDTAASGQGGNSLGFIPRPVPSDHTSSLHTQPPHSAMDDSHVFDVFDSPPDPAFASGLSLIPVPSIHQALNLTVRPEFVSTYHEPSLFLDFNDPPEVVEEELKDFDSDNDTITDADSDSESQDNNGNSDNIAGSEPINPNSLELGAASAQTDEPAVPPMPQPTSPRQRPPLSSFLNVLDSRHAPGRGASDLEFILAEEEGEVKYLEEEQRRVELRLKEAEQRCLEARKNVENSGKAFKLLHEENGITAELWAEYEKFCESLEPQFGSRGGWSITCSVDHENSYLNYDPDFTLLSESAEMSLTSCNFRCEAYTLVPTPDQQRLGRGWFKKAYVVEFWPLASPKSRTGTEETWEEQYPELYRLATQALADITQFDTQAASELLQSLPDPKAEFSGGWLFEYKREKKRANHPIKSRRWTYRSAHLIEDPGDFPREAWEDPVTDEDAANDLRSDSGDASTDEETSTDETEKDADIMDIWPANRNFGMKVIDMNMDVD